MLLLGCSWVLRLCPGLSSTAVFSVQRLQHHISGQFVAIVNLAGILEQSVCVCAEWAGQWKAQNHNMETTKTVILCRYFNMTIDNYTSIIY